MSQGLSFNSTFRLAVLVGLWLLVSAHTWAAELIFERLLTDDSNTQDNISAITAINQDQQGFMWFGGENGLARYDGHNWQFYHEGDAAAGALTGNFITDIQVDRTGVLWVASQKGLNRYDPVRNRFEGFVHDAHNACSLGDNFFRSIAVDKNYNLWLASYNGL